MTNEGVRRKITAILSADVVGYSRLMEADEETTVRTLQSFRKTISDIIHQHHGRVVDSPGDNLLSEFGSVVDAVQCAVEIQHVIKAKNTVLPQIRRMEFRIGINLGDVIEEADRIYGDGVNIAARIEGLADAGGICISDSAYQQIKSKLALGYEDLGEHSVKNITEPVRVYKIPLESRGGTEADKVKTVTDRKWRNIALCAIAILIVVGLAFLLNLYFKPTTPSEIVRPEKATVLTEKPSIAVLPFENMSDDPAQEYFSHGMADEIINGLAKNPGLIVKGRTSSFSDMVQKKDIKTIAELLNVTHVVEGSVRKSDNHIRVIAQLISTKEDSHIWSGKFDRELTDVFAIQDEITGAILKALNIHLLGSHKRQTPTNNMEAYKAYLLGRQRILKDTPTSTAEAVGYFQQAIDLDKDFALAYVGLADSCMYHMEYSGLAKDEWLTKAEDAIERALRIDAQLGEAFSSLGWLRWWQSDFTDFEKAEIAFKRSLELNPNYIDAHLLYAIMLQYAGRFEEALDQFKKAIELDPLDVATNRIMARPFIAMGRFDEALMQYDKVIEIDPLNAPVFDAKGFLYVYLGQLDKAAAMFIKAISLEPNSPGYKASLGQLYLNLGDIKQAEYWIKQAIEMSPQDFSSNIDMFSLNKYLGKEELALEYGRKLLKIRPKNRGNIPILACFQDLDLQAGRYEEARAWFGETYPELLNDKAPKIDFTNYRAAVAFAPALIKTGDQTRANLLLNDSLKYIKTISRLGGFYGYGIEDVRIYTLLGQNAKALDSLREAVDAGWRTDWIRENSWWSLHQDSILKPLHDDPEFKAITQEIEADMAVQLARVREIEKTEFR